MRSPSLALLCLALLLPSGCSSTSSVDALRIPAPSHEKTASIGRPDGPVVPPASIGAGPDAEMAVADEPKKPETQEAKAEEKKPDPKPEEKKPDAIAKELKKEEDKKLKEAKAEPKAPKKPAKKEYKDFQQLAEAALKDVREPQRQAAAGNELNPNAALGRAKGLAAQLSQSEIDALRERIKQCWQPPLGAEDAQDLKIVFHVMFNQNGTVLRGPDVVEGAPSSLGPIFAESARRAILQCQPYTMLHREHYAQWRDMEMEFSLRDMFR